MRIDSIVLREIRMPLVEPFVTSFGKTTDRRVLLAEIHAEGLVGWGECVAGEHPYFSAESIDTAWVVLMQELAPMLRRGPGRAWRRLPEDLQEGARQPDGEGCARKRNLGPGSADRRRAAVRAAGRDAKAHCVRRLDRHAAHDGAAAAKGRARGECGLQAHQTEVPARAGTWRCWRRCANAGRRSC